MKKRQTPRLVWMMTLALISVGMLMPAWTEAGSLEPAAAPAPTMKTLDQVEPRIPIPGSATEVDTYTISQSGAYYLTGDRVCSSTGIQVDADDVTIDLMGYSLIGPGSGTDSGIRMGSRKGVEIRNGTVRGFNLGIYESSTSGKGHRVIEVRCVANGLSGIYLRSSGNLVKDCTVEENGNSAASTAYGIYANNGSTVIGNTINNNGDSAAGYVYGIYTGLGSTVTNNTVRASGNSATGPVYGIYAAAGTVTNNTANYNGSYVSGDVYGIHAAIACTVSNNISSYSGFRASGANVYGIYANAGSTVTSNTAYYNGPIAAASNVHGIDIGTGSTVTKNTAYNNGSAATGSIVYGIYLRGNNLVDQNTAYNNNGTNMNSCATCTFGMNHTP
jgi:hypothetical protein